MIVYSLFFLSLFLFFNILFPYVIIICYNNNIFLLYFIYNSYNTRKNKRIEVEYYGK